MVADIVANTILFIAKKDSYVQWCINIASTSLNRDILDQQQQRQFSFNQQDFYNCNRTWEDELKFTILCTILIIALYVKKERKKSNLYQKSTHTLRKLDLLGLLLIFICSQA